MIDQVTVQTAVELLVAGIAGFGLGRLYFIAVRRTAELYGSARDWRLPVVLTAFLGFLAARRLALRGAREEAA